MLSTFQMTQDAGQILAPILVGAVAQTAGFNWAFAMCGVLCGITFIIWLAIGKETKQ